MSTAGPNTLLFRALCARPSGFDLDILAKLVGLYRVRRKWWFDETDLSLRRRCRVAFNLTHTAELVLP